MNTALRASWKTLPPPQAVVSLAFEATFSATELLSLQAGVIPKEMEDKWFIYQEDNRIHFHRSWTGAEIFCITLQNDGDVWRVVDSWVNGDSSQYRSTDLSYDRELLRFLIEGLVLQRKVAFPMPKGFETDQPGLVQHFIVGRGGPEKSNSEAKLEISKRADSQEAISSDFDALNDGTIHPRFSNAKFFLVWCAYVVGAIVWASSVNKGASFPFSVITTIISGPLCTLIWGDIVGVFVFVSLLEAIILYGLRRSDKWSSVGLILAALTLWFGTGYWLAPS